MIQRKKSPGFAKPVSAMDVQYGFREPTAIDDKLRPIGCSGLKTDRMPVQKPSKLTQGLSIGDPRA